ncbi:MAG: FtsW/RodA/SpoVE family cell cycle protein [Crocinitomicaceae bacterium]
MKEYIKYLKGDRVIWIITMLMLAFSLVSVYSFVPILVKIQGGTPFKYLFKHFIYVLIAFFTMFWIHKKDPKYFSRIAKFGYYVAIGLLIFTFFFGTKINDAGRWIKIPFVGLTFQSSDFAKLALILTVSRLLVVKKDLLNNWKEGFLPVMIPIFVICGLIFKDNFSTAALIFMVSLTILFIAKVPFGKLSIVFGVGIVVITLAVTVHKLVPSINLLPRYQTWENRITNLGEGEKNILANAQSLNAQLAIYNGGVIGQGVGDGKLKEYLPEAYADFYYSSFVEEFGFIAAVFLVFLYLILFYRILQIGIKSEKRFETYVCLGIGVLILTQASVNMLVCTGVFPVTGQNMPLLAMGGSALIMTAVSLGIVQSIAYKQIKNDSSEEELVSN